MQEAAATDASAAVAPAAVEDRFETIRQPGPPEVDPAGQGSRAGFYRYGRHVVLSLTSTSASAVQAHLSHSHCHQAYPCHC